jgi:hypothetical protein
MVGIGFLSQQRCDIAPMLRELGFRALSERAAILPPFPQCLHPMAGYQEAFQHSQIMVFTQLVL